MKKLLLTLIALTTIMGTYAQRRSATKELTIGIMNATCTYNYIYKDGTSLYDGPVTVKGSADQERWLGYQLGYMRIKQSYNLSASNKEGLLHGPISMKYTNSGSAPSVNVSTSETQTFSGSYNNGLPNGRFLYTSTYIDGGKKTEKAYLDVTYKNGVFCGPFTLRDNRYEEGYNPRANVKGQFSADGQLTGKWSVWYKNPRLRDFGSYWTDDTNYEFLNGVLIGGDLMPKDPNIINLSKKYAQDKISEYELMTQGVMVEEVNFSIYGYRDEKLNLYNDVKKIFSDYINFYQICDKEYACQDGVSVGSYVRLVTMPYLSDEEFNTYVKNFKEGARAYEYKHKIQIESHSFSLATESGELTSTYYSIKSDDYDKKDVFITEAQKKQLEELVDTHNANVDQNCFNAYKAALEKYYLDPDDIRDFTSNNKYYDIVNIRDLEYVRGVGLKYTLDACVSGADKNSQDYRLYSYTAICEGDRDYELFNSPKKIRNKYDEIDARIKSISDRKDEVIKEAKRLVAEENADRYPMWVKQLENYKLFLDKGLPGINHDDLDATIEAYNKHFQKNSGFCTYLDLCYKALKNNDKLKEANIEKLTLTTLPTIPEWSEDLKMDELYKVFHEQCDLFEGWDIYNELRDKAIEANTSIAATKSPAIKEYTTLYQSTINTRTTIDDGIDAFEKLIAAQTEVNKYLPIYNQIASNNAKLSTTLKPAKCAAKAYKAYYKGTNIAWTQSSNPFDTANKVLEIQKSLEEISQRTTLAADEKRVKAMKLTNIEDIIAAYNNTTPAVAPAVAEPKPEAKTETVAETKPEKEKQVEPKSETQVVAAAPAKTKAPATPKKTFNKESGYFSTISVSYLQALDGGEWQSYIDSPDYMMEGPSNNYISISYTGGYQFNGRHYLGANIGVSINAGPISPFGEVYAGGGRMPLGMTMPRNHVLMPLSLYYRFNILPRRITPFVACAVGGTLSTPIKARIYNTYYFQYSSCAPFVNPQVGVDFNINEKYSVLFGVGFNLFAGPVYTDINSFSFPPMVTLERAAQCGLDFHVGFSF